MPGVTRVRSYYTKKIFSAAEDLPSDTEDGRGLSKNSAAVERSGDAAEESDPDYRVIR